MQPQKSRTALIAGASGLVGGECLRILLAHELYTRVTVIGRRLIPIEHEKLVQHTMDFDRLDSYAGLVNADDIFCCLGTTIKKAGSQDAFRKVDFSYPLALATIALQNYAKQFLLVSSLGADPKSSVFYLRVKGETEEAIGALPFTAVHIFRPSMLTGKRTEFRLGEVFFSPVVMLINPLLLGKWKKFRSIDAGVVASAMVRTAISNANGVNVYDSDLIQEKGK